MDEQEKKENSQKENITPVPDPGIDPTAAELMTDPAASIAQPKETPATSTNNMEIHHYPPLPHKTLWKEYLFEFYLPFPAVSTDFFVENLRDHYVEKKRASEYAFNMTSNLKTGKAVLNQNIFREEPSIKFSDTFLKINPRNDIRQIPTDKFYWCGWQGSFISQLYFVS